MSGNIEDYIHRIGRTGRAGATVSFCLPSHCFQSNEFILLSQGTAVTYFTPDNSSEFHHHHIDFAAESS
jgi:superfamily II DNA/RNA helicase